MTGWWREAVVHQVYLRSFADSDGDGTGDVAGLRARLPYLAALGVDALWINPWYPSPLVDGGYDIVDHRALDPRYGTLADADRMVADAHRLGLRVLLDLVPNHTSDRHPWFRAAVAAGPGSAPRSRYLFRPGRDGGPPNNWLDVFGGSAWTQVDEEWYLHLFSAEQPDLDWTSPEVRADVEATLRFWFDRGVDGFRIDVAHSLVKEAGLPDLAAVRPGTAVADLPRPAPGTHPHWDREEVHEVYRSWRRIAAEYDPPRVFVAEAWVEPADRLARYVRPDELHSTFAFGLLAAPWRAADVRAAIDDVLAAHLRVGALPTWVLANHDTARLVSRLARQPQDGVAIALHHLAGRPADLAAGTRRARGAVLLLLALPGSCYLYQGEELGLPEVEDLPAEALEDPEWTRSGHTRRGRDGCRVPLPWTPGGPPYGFGPPGSVPWLPQPPSWDRLAVGVQSGDPGSMLELHRAALRRRRSFSGDLRWEPAPPGVLAFTRGPRCVLNLGPVPVPVAGRVLLSSAPLGPGGTLPPDAAAWLDPGPAAGPAGG